MKALLVIENLGSGGAERQITGLAIQLKQHGFNVGVLYYHDDVFYKHKLDENGVYSELYSPALNRYTRVFKLCKRVNELKPDIVVSFLPGPNVALSIGKLLGILHTKLVVSERNYTWKWTFKNRLFVYLYLRNQAIVANSTAEANNIKERFPILREKVFSIPNFVEYDQFLPAKSEKSTKLRILTVARIRDYKNVHGMIKTATILKNMGVDFIIDWYGYNYNDSYGNEISELIRSNDLSQYFFLREPTKNIEELYPKYDLFCLPSFKEGYPNVIIEAMSCQLPIICSRICENPNIVKEGVNGFLFNPNDPMDIAKAVLNFSNLSEDERFNMGLQNRKKIIANNSINVFAEKYIDLIKKISL